MSSLLDEDDLSANDAPAPLEPVSSQQQKHLPQHILRRIFKLLPVPSLPHVALASRDFKSLVYDDAIWNPLLHDVLKNDSSNLSDMLEHGDTFPNDNHGQEGVARLQFKRLYEYLMPYYIDLRHKHRESRVLLEYGQEPVKCGELLSRLVSFGNCHAVDDWKEINESLDAVCQYFETASLQEFEIAYDVTSTAEMKTFADALIALSPVSSALCQQTFIQKHPIFSNNDNAKPENNFKTSRNDLEPFKGFMADIKNAFVEQSHVIAKVFPEEMDMFYLFVDRALEDVVSEYVSSLLATAHERDQLLYLNTMSTVLTSVRDTINALTGGDLPINIDRERGINLLYKLFIPFLDDYLSEEQLCVKTKSQELIDEWNLSSGVRRGDDPTSRLSNQSRETFKRNYLMAFKKVMTVPVDLVSSAATTIASPILSTLRSSEDTTTTKSPSSLGSPVSEESSLQITPPRTPEVTPITVSSPPPPKNKSLLLSRQSSHQSLRSQDTARSADLKWAMHELDMMQDFLSLDTVLQLIHLNKDAERRVEQFLNIGFPGRMQNEIQKAYEQIFVQLARFLGNQHIKPAFDRAIEHLDSYTPDMDSLEQSPGDVPPLTEFFEMVHIGDVIQQMVQLYYDERISKHVDKFDFLNDVNKEKKVFERILDDCVACGMDQSIQVLLAQVEYILVHEQKPEDYNPRGDVLTDLKPTKACQDTIECLRSNTSILRGAAEKSTMDLFFNEIGRRFAEVLYKHLKTVTVSEQGGFQYISDMNAYNDFAVTLRQKSVTPYFSALKALANIYIISSAPDIKNMIHDMERYHGLLKVEDLLEFAACRSDWPAIKRVVMRDMTDCSIM
ncbi:hypothetical protein O0I10_000352 [Lichtheimia ornata]|uniref:F-box domain-containing protein n=1 Tax=Lichtheimia ornata TaxID=688661 RepID=A0AAD7Y566_9FUNG|nr:uncharacterized protein O0I10_000352 [Lichtheimia ornata]KAJ8664074.1 hypothetical protein O0I10_000352 [Lichtheimia ornata]